MSEAQLLLPALGPTEWKILWIVLGSAVVALVYGLYLCWKVLKSDPGSAKMQEVAKAIEEGAMAYLGRQFRTMIVFVLIIMVALYVIYRKVYSGDPDLRLIPVGIAV